jgi:hypothetical protein
MLISQYSLKTGKRLGGWVEGKPDFMILYEDKRTRKGLIV